MPTLTIKNLKAKIGNKNILNGVSLAVRQGEIHALMGPNGSGKSTLANVILAHPQYKKTGGNIRFGKTDITKLATDKIARLGIMMAFQYPQSIPGVTVGNLVKVASLQKPKKISRLVLSAVTLQTKTAAQRLRMPEEFLNRSLNEGFSGGEKKKAEILQLELLQPKLAILDETDSGLDVDALKLVAAGINRLVKNGCSVLIITHYNRILKYVHPDRVHVMHKGKIVKSGDNRLALEIEKNGYAPFAKK